ncbi:DNA (cytosine-5)-methyltransferase 3A-like [Frankliniella occidentalis]|uniref:DNA (cytosine-5-)-methyltransferase n=1 Tax=Frankliniella occidentalis TaxID=133901 RepID=A0A9C6X626_FRAOC|nr:DNA (cytosine-5)-methyltransferase 3A-like [Frankliniella occidentalis]
MAEAKEIPSENVTAIRPSKRRKNRRSLFSYTRTKHNVSVSKSYEPATSEHFAGFSNNTVLGTINGRTTPPSDFCGFSDDEISLSMIRKTLHPLYGHCEDMFDECGQTVCTIGSKYPHEHIMKVHMIKNERKVRVLSLFDGVGSGLLVLKHHLNLDVDVYYSAEICENALMVQSNKFSGEIVMLGDVRGLKGDLLDVLGRVDLLIGGPPCSQVSSVNANKKGLSDPTSESCLYKEFIRIRDIMIQKAAEHGHLFLWMMEMTAHMELKDWETMTRDVGQKPLKTDAGWYLPVNRERLFWTNVPQIEEQESRTSPIKIDELLCPGRKANYSRCSTITSNPSNQIKGGIEPVSGRHGQDNYYILELERLQGFPDNHTAVGNLSITKRRKLIGKAWCIPQVAGILRVLTELFSVK